MSDLPNGLLPDVGALKARVRAILEEAGEASLTMDALCARLQDVYQINMQSHVGALKLIVDDVTKASALPTPVGHAAKRKNAQSRKGKRGTATNEARNHKARKATTNAPKPALLPACIFGNERRPAVVEAIRARGEKVTAARLRKHMASLWDAETNKAKYYDLARRDQERYADEKVAFDWEETTTPKTLASCFDAAQILPAHEAAPSHSAAAVAASVYSYAVSYLRPFLVMVGGLSVEPRMARNVRTRWAALQLIAAGRGPLRAPACDHTLRVASAGTATGQASLRRAVFLRGLGELQELHELRSVHELRSRQDFANGTCEFITSMLEQETAGLRSTRDDDASSDAPAARALASLRVIKAEHALLPAALIQQCAASLTELNCSALTGAVGRAIPDCKRLESLTLQSWWCCPPAAWLGLSQLHTVRGVSLRDVPAAAIAAALPRLHTLHLYHRFDDVEFSVDPSFDELLPRLRSFHFVGAWPEPSDDAETAAAVPPLPLLEDFKWRGWGAKLPRRFMGARPSTLSISDVDIAEWLSDASSESPIGTLPLARLRALTLKFEGGLPDGLVAWLLRSAPQLRQLTFDVGFPEDVHWVLTKTFTPQRFVMRPFHLQLRHLAVTSEDSPLDVPVRAKCGVRLRQCHFPRLRRLTVGDREYPV